MNTRPHHILVVDDEPANRKLLSARLARRGYDTAVASSAEEAASAIAASRPDLLLLDIFMARMSGLDLLANLRASESTASLPVILVSALGDNDHVVRGLRAGANDYVTKPVNFPILFARVEALLRGTELVRQLEVQTEILSKLAAYDELTGVFNRRSLFHALENELGRSIRYRRPLSVLLLDIDHFKRLNDTHGHSAGDVVLRGFAERIIDALRTCDIVCRYGGEEFCALLPETDAAGAERAAERVRHAIALEPFSGPVASIALTVSIGATAWCGEPNAHIPDLLGAADRALYIAKGAGRNRVHLVHPDERVPAVTAAAQGQAATIEQRHFRGPTS